MKLVYYTSNKGWGTKKSICVHILHDDYLISETPDLIIQHENGQFLEILRQVVRDWDEILKDKDVSTTPRP